MPIVHFPKSPPPIRTQNGTIAFPVVLDGWTTMAEISAAALQDHFGATSTLASELLAAFQWHRAGIEAVARKRLPERIAPGPVLLTSADFDPKGR